MDLSIQTFICICLSIHLLLVCFITLLTVYVQMDNFYFSFLIIPYNDDCHYFDLFLTITSINYYFITLATRGLFYYPGTQRVYLLP